METMNIREIRIGNIIEYLTVQNPDTWDQILVSPVTFGRLSMEPTRFKGIPLTTEWLTRFGFKLVDETMGSGIEGIKGPYYAHEALLLWSNGSEPKNAYLVHYGQGSFEKYNAVQGRWIHSVHELQNVFHAWKGQELTQI